MSNTVLIHGPQGCGKTRNAQALAEHFGCSKVVDDWNGRDTIAGGSLVLTNREDWKAHALPTARRVMPFARAMREASRDEAIERMQGLLAELPQLLASVGAKGKRGGR